MSAQWVVIYHRPNEAYGWHATGPFKSDVTADRVRDELAAVDMEAMVLDVQSWRDTAHFYGVQS